LRLAGSASNSKFDKKTRYNINWRNNSYMKKTAKHYLYSQVRTSFLNITADEMAIAIFLPVARFKKGRPY
jgi:Holliday junction resolvase-like predicted endonuclease